ncbi:hypothetical protein [Sphingomonas parapaucimobilis]|uniref:hypothetical protein n=1 Tax=Sphingomonas parapaucimobilis TaxID=28213 RepID=UPI00321A55D5
MRLASNRNPEGHTAMSSTPAAAGLPQLPALTDLAPFVSLALLEVRGRRRIETTVRAILKIASEACGGEQDIIASKPVGGGAISGALVYAERKPPSWWPGGPDEIRYHHLIVLAKGTHVSLCASDAAFREKVAESVVTSRLAAHVPRKTMTEAFVGPEAKTAWLNGIHTASPVKADAKTLSGRSLEFAIDPLGDHTYFLSALRSRPEIAGLGQPATRTRKSGRRTIGAALGRARVWINRSKDWDDFNAQVVAVIDHLSAALPQAPAGFARLASETDGTHGLGLAYSVALLPPSLTEEDAAVSNRQAEDDMRLAYESQFTIVGAAKGGFTADVSVDGEQLGLLDVALTRRGDRFDVTCDWKDPGESDLRSALKAAFQRRGGLKIYYDDGHTFADGRIYSTRFVDAEFDWTPKSFVGFDVHREKPGGPGSKLIDAIRAQNDVSLFDFVRVRWGAKGMLACDDGAMELADFVHFDPEANSIELIHVKAAGGDPVKAAAARARKSGESATTRRPNRRLAAATSADRRISVSDYEIVTAQAIKNVRHLDRDILVERLKSSGGNAMAAATWIDGGLVPSRALLIDALERTKSTLKRKVTILQPRLTMHEITECRKEGAGTKRGSQFNQLNALMLATRAAVANLGAEFTAYADDASADGR